MPLPATEDKPLKEGLGDIQDYYTIAAKDSELAQMIDKRIQTASGPNEARNTEGKRNERYWMANQLAGISLRWHNSKIVQNRIYMGVETMVPIITTKPAEPVISIADDAEEDSEQSKPFIDKLQKVLLNKYSDYDYPQQELFEMIARQFLLYKIGIPKLIWNDKMDDYTVEYVHPTKIVIGSEGHYNHDVWVAEYMEKTVNQLIEMFKDKEKDILDDLFPRTAVNIEDVGNTPVGFWEYWPEDGSYVVWKMNSVILQKKLNPYMKWKDDKTFDRDNNHFDFPHKPYIFLNSQNLGKHVWDDTSPVSQGISMQDGINYMQRIIVDTARDQGILVGAEEAIDRDELYKYTGAPDQKLSIKGGDPTKALYRVPPKDLQAHVPENQLHLESAMDNIMGVHSTTRGEKSGQKTLGQDLLSKESDYGRIDAIVRGIERMATEIYNWEIQMMLVKYDKKNYQRILGNKKGEELFTEMKEYNKKGIKIVVKPGSTLPTDKISQRQEALDLAKMNKIADLDLFKRMDFPNAMEMAKNLYLQAVAPAKLYPDLAKELEKDAAKEKEKAATANAANPPTGQPNAQAMPPMAPNGPMPADTTMAPATAPAAPPPTPMVQEAAPLPNAPVAQPDAQQLPPGYTEHTEALLQGIPVPPFEGIDPQMYQDHLTREFQFMGTDELAQQPPEIQANYARHALGERDMLSKGGAVEAQPQPPMVQ